MAPKRRTTRLNPSATPTPVTDTHTTTSVTNAQIQAMINEGVTAALAARDATRNGNDSHTSGTGARRPDTEKEMNRQILPNGEIKKLEFKELNFEGEGNRCVTYTNVSQELAQCGDRMFSRRNRTKAFQEGLVLKLEEQQQPGNRVGNAKAQAKVYAVGNAGPNPDNNVVTGSRVFNEGMSRILSKFSATKTKTSQMGKLIKDVPVVQEFPEVFFP
ncbi:hypothetical protein Tco_1346007 [Tanacetum coccineum]